MTLNEYQERAMSTRMESSRNTSYMLHGLAGEVGELSGKVGKYIRKGFAAIMDNQLVFTNKVTTEGMYQLNEELQKELGDVLWFVAGMASDLGITMEDLARQNLKKLASRKERGVIDGDGDNR